MSSDSVSIENRVATDQRNLVSDRLRNQESVEWVAMVRRKDFDASGVRN